MHFCGQAQISSLNFSKTKISEGNICLYGLRSSCLTGALKAANQAKNR